MLVQMQGTEFYPLSVALYNMGGLCLVSEPFFVFGHLLLKCIHSHMTIKKLKAGDWAVVSCLYEKLMSDSELHYCFMGCVMKVSIKNDPLSYEVKKKILKYLVQKTFHAWIGIVTTHFAEEMTGWYCATAKTDPLRSELKIKTQTKSITKAKKMVYLIKSNREILRCTILLTLQHAIS